MAKHVIWFGPVSREQRAGATLAGASEHFVTCTGDGAGGTPKCRAVAEALADAEGRHLPALLRQLGIAEGEELYVGAFSAGGSVVKVLLAHPADRAALRAVMLADATYELRGPDRRPAMSPSLVAYATEALASGEQMFVATASAAPNNRLGVAEPSGAETLARLAADVEERTGVAFEGANYLEEIDEQNGVEVARVWRRGSVVLADLGNHHRHEEHATRLAPMMWQRLLQAWVDRQAAPERVAAGDNTIEAASDVPVATKVLAVGGAALLVMGLGRMLLGEAREMAVLRARFGRPGRGGRAYG